MVFTGKTMYNKAQNSKLTQVVTLQAYIWVVYGPNKVWDANYPGWDIL
jgi:hypothetical protein